MSKTSREIILYKESRRLLGARLQDPSEWTCEGSPKISGRISDKISSRIAVRLPAGISEEISAGILSRRLRRLPVIAGYMYIMHI